MSFHEVRLPARLAFGSTGGVERRTEIATLASGFERRSTPWALGRRRYLIGANLRSLDDMAALIAFFEARRGRLYGFRFKDFDDFKSCVPSGTVSAGDQVLGLGDGARTVFPLIKTYGDVERPIRKPVEGSVRVAVGGVETQGLSVDWTTGAVTLAAAPAPGVTVTAGFQFDTPVRFDTDRIETTLESFEAGRMAAVPLIKTYGDVERPIRKPVEGSVRVAVGGVETQGLSVDWTTGVVTLASAPAAGVTVTAGFQFDTPVRFDTDRIETTLESFEAGRMAAVPLIEVRV